ncbi:hypothetical protein [Devosia sp.]|uniref:hypothetical protein n=1 Tax=Devosia sp. TaxID=1871048 RepID=UPI001B10A202|nr:hypothetical protein [Devosia sp.]MBO9587202.1 hypothetical protein [Devosia sp.]
MSVKTTSLSAALVLALFMGGSVLAQDAMAPATDGMAMDAMAPMMSDDDLAKCVEQAKAISFPDVAMVAEQACHNIHNGHDAMGSDAMGGAAMMGGDAMAPKQ